MAHCTPTRQARQIESLRAQFALTDGLPFADVLPAERLARALREEEATWRQRVYTPALTLWAFLSQVLSPEGSCRATVTRVLAWLVAQGERPCSPKTDPYCKARQRLPESLLRRLTRETGGELHQQSPDAWRWLGRRVKVVDGACVSMPDTAANQEAYPQHSAQAPGVGFPLARVVVVFCLACGTVLDAALGRYQGKQAGETALLRSLDDAFEPGDVLLGDRYYGGYFTLARLAQRGVEAVVRLHQHRRADFRRGRRLGRHDHVVAWPKPVQRPDWLDEAAYDALPDHLTVREVRVRVRQAGFRTTSLVVVTTLLDPRAVPAEELAALYRARWQVELNLRSLKAVLGMDVLRCQSPAMVRKEVWAHLLGYNLIRAVLARAAVELGSPPCCLSFKGALQAVRSFGEQLLTAGVNQVAVLQQWLLLVIGSSQVGDRPDRVEPRARKRRPKPYPLLNRPRQEAREALLTES